MPTQDAHEPNIKIFNFVKRLVQVQFASELGEEVAGVLEVKRHGNFLRQRSPL